MVSPVWTLFEGLAVVIIIIITTTTTLWLSVVNSPTWAGRLSQATLLQSIVQEPSTLLSCNSGFLKPFTSPYGMRKKETGEEALSISCLWLAITLCFAMLKPKHLSGESLEVSFPNIFWKSAKKCSHVPSAFWFSCLLSSSPWPNCCCSTLDTRFLLQPSVWILQDIQIHPSWAQVHASPPMSISSIAGYRAPNSPSWSASFSLYSAFLCF